MFTGPNINRNGLVLALDAGNIKSFRGEPTTNLSNNFRDFTGTTYSPNGEWAGTTVTKTYFSELPTPIGPGATLMTESTSSGYQGLSRYGGGGESGAHSLSAFIYPLTSNITEFTIGLLADSSNMIYFNLVTGAITYGNGISNRNSVLESVPNWPGWYRIGANFEGRNGGWVGSMGYSMYTTYSGSGVLKSMYITGVQYELKSYPTPFASGTRGTTVAAGGGWADLSGNINHGELVNGPTFNSANGGSIVFDGTDDYIQIPLNIGDTNVDYTVLISFKITSFNGNDMRLFGSYSGSTSQLATGFTTQTFRLWLQSQWNNTNLICQTNTNYVLGVVHIGTTTLLYVNGVLNSTILDRTSFFNNIGLGNNFLLSFGNYFNGNIYQTQIYNRALTAEEIQQNYNAMRGRFGI